MSIRNPTRKRGKTLPSTERTLRLRPALVIGTVLVSLLIAITAFQRSVPTPAPAASPPGADVSHESAAVAIPRRPTGQLPADATPDQIRVSALRDQSFDVAESVVRALPTSPDAICLLATVHHRHCSDRAAMQLWHACLRLDPGFADAHQMLATVAEEQGNFAEAEEHYRLALKDDPNWASIPLPLAETLVQQGKFRDALVVLERFRQQHPKNAQVWCRLGEAYQHLNQSERARACLSQALEIDPKSEDACYALSTTMRALGENKQADSYLARFQKLQSKSVRQTQPRRPHFDDVWRMQTTLINTHMAAARIYLRHGDSSAAELQCKQAGTLAPEHRECRELLCHIYEQRQDIESALQIQKELCNLAPQDPQQWLRRGILSYQAQQLGDAEQAFRRLIELAPDRAEGYLTLAQILMTPDKNPQEAITLAKQGIQLAATAPNYHILATVYATAGDMTSARKALTEALERDPENPKYLNAYRRLQGE